MTLNICCFCQYKNNLSLVYGTASNSIYTAKQIGGPNYEGKGELLVGLKYSRKLTKSFAIETGINFSVNKIQQTSEFLPFRPRTVSNGKIDILSVPVYANYTFLKYLFVNAGITTDFEINRNENSIVNNQSGIGTGFGIGGKYDFKKISVFINPFLHGYATIPFHNQNNGEILEAGLRMGIGYNF